MSMRFEDSTKAKEWLKQTRGNKVERANLDDNQKWSFKQAKYAAQEIIGEWENYESDTGEQSELLQDHESLINCIYKEMQNTYFEPGLQAFGQNVSKRHGYSTKNFVMGAIEYWVEREGY